MINDKKQKRKVGDNAWKEGEEIGCKHLHSLGYKQICFRCFGIPCSPTPFDYTTNKGVFEIKTKKLPSTQPYTFDFTPYQIIFFKKYFSKKYKTNKRERQRIDYLLERYFKKIDRYHYKKKKTTPYEDCLKKHHFKITFCKVLINIIFPDGHKEFRLLDMRTDFIDIEKDTKELFEISNKSCGLKPIRLRVKKEKISW